MAEQARARLHARVSGRVQGVGFRYFVQQAAVGLGATGWVRNRWDQSVEVLAEGERATLERLVAALQRGPRSALVDEVQTTWQDPTGEFSRFSVRRTV